MSQDSVLRKKSFDFAVRIINLYKYLRTNKREYVISKQILRSGTSIGALTRESEHAESRKDFLHKLSIGLKETNETIYWLELLSAGGYITRKMFESMISDASQILKMLIASVKTIKSRLA